jgi:glycosyltransferase involved in cell wall biosynthesis
MNVVHITPSWFDSGSALGGGERYAMGLAEHVAQRAETTLVSFGPERRSESRGRLRLEIYPVSPRQKEFKNNPISVRFLREVAAADIVHCHQLSTWASDLSALFSRTMGKRCFVTDHGGGGYRVLQRRLPVQRCYAGAVAYSEFGKGVMPERLRKICRVIPGGIDLTQFTPDPGVARAQEVLFVGRFLPHKGILDLIEAFRLWKAPGWSLRLLGPATDASYAAKVRAAAENLAVEIQHDLEDAAIIGFYRRAMITVLPSKHRLENGGWSAVPELMGLTLLESQACGTPVICTDAGAMREFVREGRTGLVVPEGDPAALARALAELAEGMEQGPEAWAGRCRAEVERFGWPQVAEEHVKLYRSVSGKEPQ